MNLLALLCSLFLNLFTFQTMGFDDSLQDLLESFSNDSHSYILRIKFPPQVLTVPTMCGYYKGNKLIFTEDFCFIPETKACTSFSLFITKPEFAPKPKCDGNNIRYFKRRDQKPGRFFHITKKINTHNNNSWKISEKNINQVPLRLPDDTIILFLDPKYIAEIKENRVLNADYVENPSITELPRIIIDPKINLDELSELAEISVLASCDLDAFHIPVKEKTQIKHLDKVTLSMQTH